MRPISPLSLARAHLSPWSAREGAPVLFAAAVLHGLLPRNLRKATPRPPLSWAPSSLPLIYSDWNGNVTYFFYTMKHPDYSPRIAWILICLFLLSNGAGDLIWGLFLLDYAAIGREMLLSSSIQ